SFLAAESDWVEVLIRRCLVGKFRSNIARCMCEQQRPSYAAPRRQGFYCVCKKRNAGHRQSEAGSYGNYSFPAAQALCAGSKPIAAYQEFTEQASLWRAFSVLTLVAPVRMQGHGQQN